MRNRFGAIDFANRRSFLRSIGAGMAAAPFIPLLEAQAATAPTRLIIMVGSNGYGRANQFFPSGSGENFTLNTAMKSLEPYRKSLILFGDEFDGRISGGAIPHPEAAANLLTGTAPTSPPTSVDVNVRNQQTRATGPSVDQVIGKAIGKGTRFESLALGVGSNSPNLLGASIVYRGDKDPITAEKDIFTSYDRLFGTAVAGGGSGASGARNGDDAKILDAVSKNLSALKGRVGAEDARRIDAHIESVAALKERVVAAANAPSGGACTPPTMPPRDNPAVFNPVNAAAMMKDVLAATVDVAVAAMKCDLTRVIVIQVGATTALWAPAFIGVRTPLHDVSHQQPDNMAKYTAATIDFGFAYLLKKLSMTTEGTGTLLDNSAVVWTNEFGDGNAHSMKSLPIIAAGGAGGKWKAAQGKVIRFGRKRRHVDFLVTLMRTFGQNVTSFGHDPSGGPITEMGV